MDELIDLYDPAGHVIGTCLRSRVSCCEGLFLSVHLVVADSRGKYLIHKRKNKEVDNGMWDIVTGVALAGEASSAAALRELKEELGVDARHAHILYRGRVVGEKNLLDVYSVSLSPDAVLALGEEEVEEVRYVSSSALAALFRSSAKEPAYISLILRLLGEG